jgi:hypothetical protein
VVATGADALKACQENFVEVAHRRLRHRRARGHAPLLDEMAVHWPETVRIAIAEDGTHGLPDDLYQAATPPCRPKACAGCCATPCSFSACGARMTA